MFKRMFENAKNVLHLAYVYSGFQRPTEFNEQYREIAPETGYGDRFSTDPTLT